MRRLDLIGLNTARGSLRALFSKVGKGGTQIRTARLRKGRLAPLGQPINFNGQVLVNLGGSTRDTRPGRIDVGLEDLRTDRRWVATQHRSRHWSFTGAFSDIRLGPQVNGPVRDGLQIVNAGTDAETEGPWELTLQKWAGKSWSPAGEGPLNSGDGNAQGGLDPVGSRIWVTWLQNAPAVKGLFPTTIHAALLDPTNSHLERELLLWSGSSFGPGPTQAVQFRGKPAFLYLRHRRTRGCVRR